METNVYYKPFYSVWKETSHKPLKEAAAEKSFLSVYIIDKTCFDECFLVHVIQGSNYLFRSDPRRFRSSSSS